MKGSKDKERAPTYGEALRPYTEEHERRVRARPPRRRRKSFEEWMEDVDRATENIAGVSIHDLADQPFRDYYDEGRSPTWVAKRALREEGFSNPGKGARERITILDFVVENFGSPGIVTNPRRAKESKCTCYGKVCYSKGVIGPLNPNQRTEFCRPGTVASPSKEMELMQRYRQKMKECGGEDIHHFIECMARELPELLT